MDNNVYINVTMEKWGKIKMNGLNDLKISSKLLLLIVIVLLSLMTVGYTGYYYLAISNHDINNIYHDKLLPIKWLNDSCQQARTVQANVFDLMLTTDKADKIKKIQEIDEASKKFDQNISDYANSNLDFFERENLKVMNENLHKFREARQAIITLALANQNEEAYRVFNQQGRQYEDDFNHNLAKLAEYNAKNADDIDGRNKENFYKAMQSFLGIIVIAAVITTVFGWMIATGIAKRMNDMIQYLGALSQGNFSEDIAEISIQDKSEFGVLLKAIDAMGKNMKGLIRQLSQTSEQLAASSQEMTASAEQSADVSNHVANSITEVAKGAENQLSLVYGTVEIVKQMSRETQQVAENIHVVSASAAKTAKTANEGELAIEKAINQMMVIDQKTNATVTVIGELEEKSQQIGQIVEVISTIAGQTNLLALNAAIEAARAGEQGRGFAVVADEVRKLAEQSQLAARQIGGLISEVQQKTDNAVVFMNDGKAEVTIGTEVVNRAGAGFREIITMIQEISTQIMEISTGIQEVTNGNEYILLSVEEIDTESKNVAQQTGIVSTATEQQAISMGEIASASQVLSRMAEGLQRAIQEFKV